MEWQAGAIGTGGPYAVPVTQAGQHVSGNARQFSGDWRALRDGAVAQDLSFRVYGETGGRGNEPDTLFVNGFEN